MGFFMRRKIQEIIRGTYYFDQAELFVEDPEALHFSVIEDETFEGSFCMKSSHGQPVRGIVTCSHPAVTLLTKEFDAKTVNIRFVFEATAVSEGDCSEGVFVVTSSVGEFLFPFSASVSRHYISTSIGKIKTLNDFANLCNLNWEEALSVFASPYFCNIFHEDSQKLSLLYRALTRTYCSSHEMEEFLIGAGKKKRCQFRLRTQSQTVDVYEEEEQIFVTIDKSQWGYLGIRIYCAEPFVSMEKSSLQTEDFIGRHAEVTFRILPQKLHSGKNFAQITFDSGYQIEQLSLVCIKKDAEAKQMRLMIVPEEQELKRSPEWQRRLCNYRLERIYLSYLLKMKSEKEWISESLDLIKKVQQQQEVPSRWLYLYMAYLHWMDTNEDAMRECMRLVPRNTRGAKTPLGAMYLYLSYLKNDVGKAEALARMQDIHTRYRSHPILTWMLLSLDDSYARNPQRKYEYIRHYMTQYSASPIFYMEAAQLLLSYPDLLNSQEEFDFYLICWMAKKNLLTKELSVRIQAMAQSRRPFSKSYLQALSKCYKRFGDENLVKTICVYLIKANQYGEAYFPWFKRGVEQQLKIAGLYEAYLFSWSRSQGELPPQLVRYFSGNNSLPVKKKAMLFAYIVRNKRRLEKDWAVYLELVKAFAAEQLAKGAMSEDLAIIYEEVRRLLPKDEWDAIKQEAEQCYRVYTDSPQFVAVQVAQQKEKYVLQRVQVSAESAYVHLYRLPYLVLFEGRNGRAYVAGEGCRINKMLPGNSLFHTQGAAPEKEEKKTEVSLSTQFGQLESMEGSIEELTQLLLAAYVENLPVLHAAQQLMIRMLFTNHFCEEEEDVFDLLCTDPSSAELVLAYISVRCRNYIRTGAPVNEAIYQFLGQRLMQNGFLNKECRVAFLQMHLTYMDLQYEALSRELFRTYLFEGEYFPFFSVIPTRLQREYLLQGLRVLFVEGEAKSSYFVTTEGVDKASMREVLPGFYTYPLFGFAQKPQAYQIQNAFGEVVKAGDVSENEQAAMFPKQEGVLKRLGGTYAAHKDDTVFVTEEALHLQKRKEAFETLEETTKSRYDHLAAVLGAPADAKAMQEYAKLHDATAALFLPIEE